MGEKFKGSGPKRAWRKLAIYAAIIVGGIYGATFLKGFALGISNQPFYSFHRGDEYDYQQSDGGLFTVRYAGIENGEHVFVHLQPSGVGEIYRCATPCEAITIQETLGLQVMNERRMLNATGTIAWEMFLDAERGHLIVARGQ